MDRTVKSEILLGSTGVSRAGFGIPLFVGAHSQFNERLRLYSSPDALEADFPEGSPERLFGEIALQQSPSVDQIAIGRWDDTDAVAKVDTLSAADSMAEGDRFRIYAEGYKVADYTADDTDDDDSVAEELESQLNASALFCEAEAQVGGAIELTGLWVGADYEITVDGPAGFSVTTDTEAVLPTETITEALGAIEAENADFYGVAVISRDATVITDAGNWTESRQKYFAGLSADDAIRSADDDDLASQLKDLGYQKTLLFHARRPWYPYEAALLANRLAVNPDDTSTTWNLVQLVGVPTDSFTETEEGNLSGKNVYHYVDDGAGGAGMEGKSIGGEWADVMIGVDWFNARLHEATYAFKKSATNTGSKVPYTDGGVSSLEAILRRRISAGQDTDFIAEDPAPEINVPRVLEVEPTQRQQRDLPPITWNARLAGAIHYTEFQGTLVP